MDFKFCPECGTKNNADTKFCTECGNRFPEETFPAAAETDSTQVARDIPAPESPAEERADQVPALQPVKKKTGLVIVIIILALLVAAGAVMYFTGNIDRMMATSRSGKGDYIGALESYEKYLSRSGNKSTAAYTEAARYALSAGDADKALMYAKSVPETNGEAERLAETAAGVLAKQAIKDRDWQGALECLKDVGGDEAKKLRDEANYHLAIEAAEREEFYEAIALLQNNSYEFAEDRLAEYRYHYGVSLMNEGKYDEAIAQFELTAFADSDDLRGECYFKNSVDYAFLTDLRDICLDIVDNDASAESVKRAADKIGEYTDRLFNDSELAFFAGELRDAFIGEIEIQEQKGSVKHQVYQKNLYQYYEKESECLEIINELYPFDSEDWDNIYYYFEPSEYWNAYISVIDTVSNDFSKIDSSARFSSTQQYIYLSNSSDYEVTITVWFYDYNEEGEFVGEDEVSAVLPANETTKIIFKAEDNDGTWNCEFRVDSFK